MTLLDTIILKVDKTLRAVEQSPSGNLMRINHTGEVCAQALYKAQALTSRNETTKRVMQEAAQEEEEHLRWCAQRLDELNTHTSYLNPIWAGGSFMIGCVAGIAGDKWSLGFLEETETQVVNHLTSHIERLPEDDHESRAILEKMREDELRHATTAQQQGAAELPKPVKSLMGIMSKVMTSVTYYI